MGGNPNLFTQSLFLARARAPKVNLLLLILWAVYKRLVAMPFAMGNVASQGRIRGPDVVCPDLRATTLNSGRPRNMQDTDSLIYTSLLSRASFDQNCVLSDSP